jgi:MscS family membrane protein
VEDIGLRSTKIRLLTGHLVTLPNDLLAGSDIENIGRRHSIRRNAAIHIPLDTPSEKVEKALAIIREKLADHEGMDPTLPPRIFFDEISEDAFVLRFFYWYTPPDYWEFKAFGERMNLEIFHAFEAEGIQFSLPSRYSLWKRDEEQGPQDEATYA